VVLVLDIGGGGIGIVVIDEDFNFTVPNENILGFNLQK
jgi:hypothetical protein